MIQLPLFLWLCVRSTGIKYRLLCFHQPFMCPFFLSYSPLFVLLNTHTHTRSLSPSLSPLSGVRQLCMQPPNERNREWTAKKLDVFPHQKANFHSWLSHTNWTRVILHPGLYSMFLAPPLWSILSESQAEALLCLCHPSTQNKRGPHGGHVWSGPLRAGLPSL